MNHQFPKEHAGLIDSGEDLTDVAVDLELALKEIEAERKTVQKLRFESEDCFL